MGTEKKQLHYPGFAHPASALSAWAFSIDVFIISLKGGKLVRHTPEDIEAFSQCCGQIVFVMCMMMINRSLCTHSIALRHNILSSDLLKHKLIISADPLKNVHQSFINGYYILPYVYESPPPK